MWPEFRRLTEKLNFELFCYVIKVIKRGDVDMNESVSILFPNERQHGEGNVIDDKIMWNFITK